MSAEREQFGTCESCDTKIYEDTRHYYTADGCYLCEEHAPMLSDCIGQHEEILASEPWRPDELPYDTREEMQAALDELKAQLADHGDHKLLIGGDA